MLAFAVILAGATGLLCGLLPAWRVSRIDINEILKQSGRNSAGERHRTRYLLVIGQATLSMILLAGAALTIESIVRLNAVPLGFRPDQILAAEVALPPAAYPKLSQRSSFYQQALARVSALPAVDAVALCSALAWEFPMQLSCNALRNALEPLYELKPTLRVIFHVPKPCFNDGIAFDDPQVAANANFYSRYGEQLYCEAFKTFPRVSIVSCGGERADPMHYIGPYPFHYDESYMAAVRKEIERLLE